MSEQNMVGRTHRCGELTGDRVGEDVLLNGWIHTLRDHGQVLFLVLRDRYGRVQCVVDPDENENLYRRASDLHMECCIAVSGTVRERPDDMKNPDMETGGVEVEIEELEVLSESDPLPFPIGQSREEDRDTETENRLRYRYLDLRRPEMQENIQYRSAVVETFRSFFEERDFLDIETPFMVRETPGGARTFLVPNRHDAGTFFALAESPQVYKQLLMVAGYDRYYQIVRCFRDEDLRKDRQPEFTQLDVEMAFVDQEDVIEVTENCMERVFSETREESVSPPFPRMNYHEAIRRYGTDKPDTRYGMELVTLSDIVADSDFNIFSSTVEEGGTVRGLCIPGGAELSRSDIDEYESVVQGYDLPGLTWFRVTEDGLEGSVAKYLSEEEHQGLRKQLEAEEGDLLMVVAHDHHEKVHSALGGLRTRIAEDRDMIPEDLYHFLWIVNFPLFEREEETGDLAARHHPFTRPHPEDVAKLEENPDEVRARAYDLVLNGYEVAGGSIRVHEPELQERLFSVLGMDREEIEEKFSFLLEALSYGPPPHGGIALGLDRFIMALEQLDSIRDCIPFPRTGRAYDPMSDSPSTVEEEKLRELGIQLTEEARQKKKEDEA